MASPYTPLPSNGQTTTSSRLTADQSRSGMLIMYVSLFMLPTIAAGLVYAVGEVFAYVSEQLFDDVMLCVLAESLFEEKEMTFVVVVVVVVVVVIYTIMYFRSFVLYC